MCHIIKTLKTITLALPEMGYYYHHYKATNFGRHQLHHENDEGDWNISFFFPEMMIFLLGRVQGRNMANEIRSFPFIA